MVASSGQQYFKDHYTELHIPPLTSTAPDPTGNLVTRTCSDPLYYPLPESIAQDDDIWLNLNVKITDLGVGVYIP